MRTEIFNSLFEQGYEYTFYSQRSERQKARIDKVSEIARLEVDKIDSEIINFIDTNMKVLVISENWCSDCANATPTLSILAEKMKNWEYKIIGKDDIKDEQILKQYTTAGRQKIPVVIFADSDGDEITRWIERPSQIYHELALLQAKKLPKEEYITEYKELIKPDRIVKLVLDTLIELATHSASLLSILPKKKLKPNKF